MAHGEELEENCKLGKSVSEKKPKKVPACRSELAPELGTSKQA